MSAVSGNVTGEKSVAVTGTATGKDSIGVLGQGDLWGVQAQGAIGVRGEGRTWNGVEGISQSTSGGFGVFGANTAGGTGVCGVSDGWIGVYGESKSTAGGAAVRGDHKAGGTAVAGIGDDNGLGIFGKGGRLAGLFEGDVEVTGDIRLTNADCAEDFEIGNDVAVDPGTVMALADDGALYPSRSAYDKRVVGVVSGAGELKPGIVLDRHKAEGIRQPIGLLGKVYCKADARYGSIEVGDLLTTSATPGHAMKIDNPMMALGAILGKALEPLKASQGLIRVLISLQ